MKLKEVRSKRDEREAGLSKRAIEEIKEVSKKIWGKRKKEAKQMKAKIIYDPVTGAGALYFDGVQLCDVQLPDGQRKAINQLITQHILKKKGV